METDAALQQPSSRRGKAARGHREGFLRLPGGRKTSRSGLVQVHPGNGNSDTAIAADFLWLHDQIQQALAHGAQGQFQFASDILNKLDTSTINNRDEVVLKEVQRLGIVLADALSKDNYSGIQLYKWEFFCIRLKVLYLAAECFNNIERSFDSFKYAGSIVSLSEKKFYSAYTSSKLCYYSQVREGFLLKDIVPLMVGTHTSFIFWPFGMSNPLTRQKVDAGSEIALDKNPDNKKSRNRSVQESSEQYLEKYFGCSLEKISVRSWQRYNDEKKKDLCKAFYILKLITLLICNLVPDDNFISNMQSGGFEHLQNLLSTSLLSFESIRLSQFQEITPIISGAMLDCKGNVQYPSFFRCANLYSLRARSVFTLLKNIITMHRDDYADFIPLVESFVTGISSVQCELQDLHNRAIDNLDKPPSPRSLANPKNRC